MEEGTREAFFHAFHVYADHAIEALRPLSAGQRHIGWESGCQAFDAGIDRTPTAV
ncbi:MAG TPA: hypothetical protein VFU43_16525 [Streptosporangiaceae bacterium]|nr:hypothetical protein [Streptosporangiaceae bacterium]